MFKKKQKTIDSVLSGITKITEDLSDLVAYHHSTAEGHLVQASFHEDEAAEHAAARDRARRIVEKFETLLV